MNKFLNISIALMISSFLALNFYLLFGEKSVIPKSLYVNQYEHMTAKDYRIELEKEALVAPLEVYTVYLDDEDAVDLWLISEGDRVTVGQELALLNTGNIDSEREVWEAERDALLQQETELNQYKSELEKLKSQSYSTNEANVDRQDGVTEIEDKATIELELQIGFSVDVTQEGSFSQAITSLNQQLTDITRRLAVVDAQLNQNHTKPALISPAEGIVANIERHGSNLSVDIYSAQKVLVTYLKDYEWKGIEEGQFAEIQGEGLPGIENGTVLSVSAVQAKEDEFLTTYKQLDRKQAVNPLAYYEMRIFPDEELDGIPYSTNVNTSVVTNEALDAVSIKEKWLKRQKEQTVLVTMLDADGKPQVIEATAPFSLNKHAVITEGVKSGNIVLYEPTLRQFQYAPKVFLSIPEYKPTIDEWKKYGWRNYLEAMLLR